MTASLKPKDTPENFQIDFQNTSVDIWETKYQLKNQRRPTC